MILLKNQWISHPKLYSLHQIYIVILVLEWIVHNTKNIHRSFAPSSINHFEVTKRMKQPTKQFWPNNNLVESPKGLLGEN
jgi:hypothetical protein